MPIKGSIVNEGATLSSAGGTAVTYANVPSTGAGVVVAILAVAFNVRPTSIFLSKLPVLQSDGTYSNGEMRVVHKRPKLLASGKVRICSSTHIVSWHPEQTPAELAELWLYQGQVCSDSDFAAFRAAGSLD